MVWLESSIAPLLSFCTLSRGAKASGSSGSPQWLHSLLEQDDCSPLPIPAEAQTFNRMGWCSFPVNLSNFCEIFRLTWLVSCLSNSSLSKLPALHAEFSFRSTRRGWNFPKLDGLLRALAHKAWVWGDLWKRLCLFWGFYTDGWRHCSLREILFSGESSHPL